MLTKPILVKAYPEYKKIAFLFNQQKGTSNGYVNKT